jgi:hypothetical protein
MNAKANQDHLTKPGPYVARLQETDFNAFIDYQRLTAVVLVKLSMEYFFSPMYSVASFFHTKS